MENKEVIKTLTNLAEISRDGEQGFRTAAKEARDPQLKTAFENAAERCAVGARELESQIADMGGSTSHSGSIAGTWHRVWTSLRSIVTGHNDKSILEEVERGEDIAKSAYEIAISKPLPPNVREIVDRQYRGVRENHDRVRDLRNRAA
ncbi:PA2169 family four-helix-bundle protein [Methylocystis parvus]|uniref:PA2169 family four-helix-bundle protein n=1 Tax=Methylocystis parvus TaxID=134 RepID=A0A6B8M8L5_9HYPH|nr:PA2169 family four-helix-bundle protein [Methylocystis parvus]QGM98936.1 PA2169 family four-helix-bundle protein [Methylocystis parvus]WBK00708.1 PA2169 family four-helix-bundle protein [Methylocystis parvus OBBP]